MSLITTDNIYYYEIANAIRFQNGEVTTYKPDQMGAAIRSLGGGSMLAVGYATENFQFSSLGLTWECTAEEETI